MQLFSLCKISCLFCFFFLQLILFKADDLFDTQTKRNEMKLRYGFCMHVNFYERKKQRKHFDK